MSTPSLPRLQHICASGAIAAVGIWITWLSYTQEPADAFLFPRLISTVFVVLALWTFGKALLGWTKVGNGLSTVALRHLAPGLLVALVYLFWGAETLGFYTAGAIAFFLLLTLYDPAPHNEAKTWIKRAVMTAVYVAVMYALFAMLLKIYTPREIFF